MTRTFGRILTGAICLALLTLTSGLAHGTTVGMDASPLSSRLNPTVQFAYWDTFTQTEVPPATGTYTFDGVPVPGSQLTGLGVTQSSPHAVGVQGSGLLESGDIYYSSTSAQNWTLDATASIAVESISFQIKTANINTSIAGQYFTPTLTGEGAGTFHSVTPAGTEMIFGFQAYVIEYRWEGLSIAASTPLEIQFAMAGGPAGDFTRKPVDFISLDVSSAAVPEPGSALLLGLGGALSLCGLVWRRRRQA